MQTIAKLGVWMDHSSAHLIEFAGKTIQLNHILAEAGRAEKSDGLCKDLALQRQSRFEYYGRLAALISHYKEVVLFGPSDAKSELYSLLAEDQRFSGIKIDLQPCTKLTENQEHNFVKKYFTRELTHTHP